MFGIGKNDVGHGHGGDGWTLATLLVDRCGNR